MGLRINTNIQSLNGQRHLINNANNLKNTLEHLASGSRINKAADDAAGLAISEKIKAQIRSMRQASRNANDGVSLIQVAEGAMSELSNIMIRMRELAMQSASDTIGDKERALLNKEIGQLKLEVDRISNSTEYDGTRLLDGGNNVLEFQVGIYNNPMNDRLVFDTTELNSSASALGVESVTADTKVAAQSNLAVIDEAIDRINGNRAVLGALQNRMQSTISNLAVYRESLEAANSRIRDADMAEEASELVKQNILNQTNVAVLTQANQSSQLALKLFG